MGAGGQQIYQATERDSEGNRVSTKNYDTMNKELYGGFQYFNKGRIDDRKVQKAHQDFTNPANNWATGTTAEGVQVTYMQMKNVITSMLIREGIYL